MKSAPFLVTALLPCALASSQVVQEDPLTSWVHVGGAPSWTDDVAEPTSRFGTVDHLNSINTLLYTSSPISLAPGTYVAAARVRKVSDQIGAAPLELSVLGAGLSGAPKVLDVAAQTPNAWVNTPGMVFTVTAAGPVLFVLQNSDTNITKQNYDFDSFVVGEIDVGPVVIYENMGRTWGHAWGLPYYDQDIADADSPLGYVERLNQVWWVEWGWPWRTHTMNPGFYTANVRVKKTVSTASAQWLDLLVDTGSGARSVRLEIADQIVGQYVYTPNLSFEVTTPGTQVQFQLANTTGSYKQNYHIDSFLVRRGQSQGYGQGCSSSLGQLGIEMSPPATGQVCRVKLANAAPLSAFGLGFISLSIDLTPIGGTGCWLLNSLDLTVPLAVTGGVGELGLDVPADPGLHGLTVFGQGISVEPGTNTLGIVTSDGAAVVID